MTRLREIFVKKSVKKAEVSRTTGINPSKLSELSLNPTTKLRLDELHLISLAIYSEPSEVPKDIFGDLRFEQ